MITHFKKMLFIGLLISLTGATPVLATQEREITVTARNIAKLPLWHRIKHAIQEQLNRAFNIKKTLPSLIKQGNVVVKFYRPGCPYCVYIDPLLEQIKSEHAHEVTFINVNLNAQTMNYKSMFNFGSVPTLVYFANGKEVLRHGSNDGTITKEELKKNIATAFGMKNAPVARSIKSLPAFAKASADKQTSRSSTSGQAGQAAPGSKLTAQERSCLGLLISLAKSHITELSAQLHAFFDTNNNKEPYRAHVEKFYQILTNIDKAINAPLKSAIGSTDNSEYQKLLTLVQSIVQDLHKNLLEAHAVFKKNEGKDPLIAAAALRVLKQSADARRPHIEGKLKNLHAHLLSLDSALAHEIDTIHKSLPKIFESELSNLVMLNRLKQRLKS